MPPPLPLTGAVALGWWHSVGVVGIGRLPPPHTPLGRFLAKGQVHHHPHRAPLRLGEPVARAVHKADLCIGLVNVRTIWLEK